MKNVFERMWRRLAGLPGDGEGFVLMSTLAIFLFLFVLCASIYAVGETIHQKIRMQNACDAAAYSAAVVQADGLSRMATVNRAMAWSYVQMTNRQMDYITYRWLKLTAKRFGEDKDNAEKYHANLIFAVDKELSWWALLEVAVTAVISELLDHDCSGTLGGKVKSVGHNKEGHGWWCGLEVRGRTEHNIRFNLQKNDSFWEAAKSGAIASITDRISTYDNLSKLLKPLKFVDSGGEWGGLLGKLIDYDKKNIQRMNDALVRINAQMNVSMKMTAESVLKSMLRDPRVPADKALQDYYISIRIPEGRNPYPDSETGHDAAPATFFSPLHNTEAEEMLFLNMPSTDSVDKSLFQHFPVLGPTGLAFGLDQWFIRGRGNYSDGKDHGYDGAGDVSFKESSTHHTATMFRDEGLPGIQRIYKDTNLNETGAGFMSTNRQGKVGDHPARWVSHSKSFAALPECCRKACDVSDTKGKVNKYHIAAHPVYGKIPDEKNAVWRGNHLIDFMNVTSSLTDGLKGFIEGSIGGGGSKGGSLGGISDEAALNSKMEQIKQDTIAKGGTVSDDDPFSKAQSKGGGNSSVMKELSSKQGLIEQGAGLLLDGLSGAISNMIGSFIDVMPSCEHDPSLEYAKYPMCRKIESPTTALYSEYRWASCKWFCVTKLFTWLVCLIFDEDIYCDWPKAKLEVSFLGISFDVVVEGYGHIGWPKWFCGHDPYNLLLDIIPPLIPESISGGKHGYMDSNYNFGSDGFLRPLQALWGDEKERTFSRKEYESCAMFPDGLDNIPVLGHFAWPGLVRGHARIYGDDKEIFDNRYVGARCKPWVLNERFFAGDGTIVVGAAMKHVNPFVQLFNLWNAKKAAETQKQAEKTVLSAFNLPEDNYMWTMAAARAGVRHRRRNGEFDQERQYQVTYDPTCDVENLSYQSSAVVFGKEGKEGNHEWVTPEQWGQQNGKNANALSRVYFAGAKKCAVWNGCPCGGNETQFRYLWNLCETDWDATLLPVRYAGRKAELRIGGEAFNDQNYDGRLAAVQKAYGGDRDSTIGNGKNWRWQGVTENLSSFVTSNPFVSGGWKKADAGFFEDLVMNALPGELTTGISSAGGLNLRTRIPTGKKLERIDVTTILKDRIL